MIDIWTVIAAVFIAGALCGAAVGYALATAPRDPDEHDPA